MLTTGDIISIAFFLGSCVILLSEHRSRFRLLPVADVRHDRLLVRRVRLFDVIQHAAALFRHHVE